MRIDWRHLIKANGNIKLGNSIGTISKLAGNGYHMVYDDKPEPEKVQGSCGEFCTECGNRKGCYVFKSYRYGSVIKSHARTTEAFRQDIGRAFIEMDEQLNRKHKPFKVVRINQSGELESESELLWYMWLARRHKETKFFFYTKAFKFLFSALDIIQEKGIPENMTILVSIWHEYGIQEYEKLKDIPGIKAFVYMDNFDYQHYGIKPETFCPAYDESGKMDHNMTCDKCRKCFDRKCKIIGTYPH